MLLVCFAAGTAAGASVASASIEGIVENVVQVQCTVRFMQYVLLLYFLFVNYSRKVAVVESACVND